MAYICVQVRRYNVGSYWRAVCPLFPDGHLGMWVTLVAHQPNHQQLGVTEANTMPEQDKPKPISSFF